MTGRKTTQAGVAGDSRRRSCPTGEADATSRRAESLNEWKASVARVYGSDTQSQEGTRNSRVLLRAIVAARRRRKRESETGGDCCIVGRETREKLGSFSSAGGNWLRRNALGNNSYGVHRPRSALESIKH